MAHSRARRVLSVAAVLLASASAPLRGSAPLDQAEGGANIFAYLDSIDGVPGTDVTVPLTLFFTATPEAPIQTMRARICVEDQFVRFDRVDVGSAGKAAGAAVTARREAKADDCAPIVVEMKFIKAPQRGTLANLVFRIEEQAPVGRRVKVQGAYTLAGSSGEEPKVAPSESEITIVEKVIPACFFYMH